MSPFEDIIEDVERAAQKGVVSALFESCILSHKKNGFKYGCTCFYCETKKLQTHLVGHTPWEDLQKEARGHNEVWQYDYRPDTRRLKILGKRERARQALWEQEIKVVPDTFYNKGPKPWIKHHPTLRLPNILKTGN